MEKTNKKTTRLDYVDVFRGLALLIMITIQIFDYLSKSSIYTTPPYYVETINSVTWVPPSLLFAFVSGISIWLLIQKLSLTNQSKTNVLFGIVKRYGIYIVISLPFTILMWDLATYLAWEEVLQGIGLAAIITAFFILLLPKIKYEYIITTIILTAFMQSYLPHFLDSSSLFSDYSRTVNLDDSYMNIFISVLLNAFIRGWFSVVNIFPIMLGGILFIRLIQDKRSIIQQITFASSFLSLSVILHLLGYTIDYYGRSFSLTFFAIGESAALCFLLYYIYRKVNLKFILNPLLVFGSATLIVYFGHYLLILKVLEITKIKDTFSDLTAWIITIPLVMIVYYGTTIYLKWVKKN